MFPRRRAALLGISIFGVCATLSGAEAGRIYYTKNGQSIGSTPTALAEKR